MVILLALLFSKFVYLASLGSYYTFYLISRFSLSVQSAQIHLFVFLGAVAAGTIIGGPVGDRIGRRQVILASILGVLPFTLALPYANLFWTRILTVIIGVVLASAFSVIVVYAQELMPGRVGMIAGTVLRGGVRHQRHRRCGARRAGRPDRHLLRVPPLLVPARDRSACVMASAGGDARLARASRSARSYPELEPAVE